MKTKMKSFCEFVNSTWPRGAIDGQLCLAWFRSAIALRSFLGKFCPKSQSCQFKVKFDTQTNTNMQNAVAEFAFSVLDREYHFRENWVPRVKTEIKLKFDT